MVMNTYDERTFNAEECCKGHVCGCIGTATTGCICTAKCYELSMNYWPYCRLEDEE